MSFRMRALLLFLILLSTSLGIAKNKKVLLPTYVLKARTVYVMVDPASGISASDPLGNRKAQDDVEKAILSWGRLSPVMSAQTADLLITVRKGDNKSVQPTIGRPTNDRPVIIQQTDNSIRLGGQKGRPPGSTQDPSQESGPRPGVEVGPSQDMFAVYEGGVNGTLDRPPVWRYIAKDALHSPNVPAVAEFRKVIEEAEKQQKRP